MKKFRVFIGLVVTALFAVGVLASCTQDVIGIPENYDVVPLANLVDFGDNNNSQYYYPNVFVYDATAKTYNGSSAQIQYDQLNKRIAKELVDFEAGIEDQSTFQKILAHSSADMVLEAMAFSTLRNAQMNGLVNYMAEDTNNENFFRQYSMMQEYEKIMDKNPESSQEYRNAYKDQQRIRRKMLNRLDSIGMTGDEASRVILQLSSYAEIVVNDTMIPKMMEGVTFDEYFKALEKGGGLFDYDTLVFFKTNTSLRKDVKFAEKRQNNGDQELVRAYGYSYQYQIAGNKALNDVDFENELKYRFMDYLDAAEAKDYARIKSENYQKGYRYTADFYKTKFYPAVSKLDLEQEKIEAQVYEINEECRLLDGIKKLSGNGITSELDMSITLNTEVSYASKIAYSADMKSKGIQAGIEFDLLAADMENYYMKTADYKNAVSMAGFQKAYETTKGGGASSWAPAKLSLQKENLKMTQFVMGQFLERNKKAGLSQSLIGQIYAVAADDITTVNQLKKDIVLHIAELDGMNQSTDTVAYYEKVRVIGRVNAQLKQMVNAATGVVSTVDTQVGYANARAEWETVNVELQTALNFDYSKYPVVAENGKDTPQLNYMQYLIIKQNFTQGGKTSPYVPGIKEFTPQGAEGAEIKAAYDDNHRTSRLVINHKKVLYHTAGMIEINFKKVGSATITDGTVTGITYADWQLVEIDSGNNLKVEKKIADTNNYYPLADMGAASTIKGTLPATYSFAGWYLDQAGFYKIDYSEEVRYPETTYYPVFKMSV